MKTKERCRERFSRTKVVSKTITQEREKEREIERKIKSEIEKKKREYRCKTERSRNEDMDQNELDRGWIR